MVTVQHTIARPIDAVFAVVADPRTYPRWLVGAREIREVDEAWPAPGSSFHHRVGLAGPLTIADSSTVLTVQAPNVLALEVRARPFGRGRATFRLHAERATSATSVDLDEVPIGPLARLAPVLDPLTVRRNRRSLEQLDDYLATARRARRTADRTRRSALAGRPSGGRRASSGAGRSG